MNLVLLSENLEYSSLPALGLVIVTIVNFRLVNRSTVFCMQIYGTPFLFYFTLVDSALPC